jgi:hypothetical protein
MKKQLMSDIGLGRIFSYLDEVPESVEEKQLYTSTSFPEGRYVLSARINTGFNDNVIIALASFILTASLICLSRLCLKKTSYAPSVTKSSVPRL